MTCFNKDFIFSSNIIETESRYVPLKIESSSLSKSKGANGAIEYKKMMYQDFLTGDINYKQLAKAKSQVRNNMVTKSSTFSFVEEGPDNVGGRTRAFAVDPNQPKTMFAGSVSGGLFVSYNKGNN
jgi:hypothetical protein